MPRDYSSLPHDVVRRRDRAVTDEAWIGRVLELAPHGVFAMVHDGQPFINSNLFLFDVGRRAIYAHTAGVGRMQAIVSAATEADPGGAPVCFSTFQMGRLLPADTALEFSTEYAGVTAFGTIAIVRDAEEARSALQRFLDKYAPHLSPGADYRPITDDELARTTVFRMEIDSWSGKRKLAEADFPGAFRYPEIDLIAQV